jgi:hypothetical protein
VGLVVPDERRVVGHDRTDADEYGVVLGSEAVYAGEVLVAGDADLSTLACR